MNSNLKGEVKIQDLYRNDLLSSLSDVNWIANSDKYKKFLFARNRRTSLIGGSPALGADDPGEDPVKTR